MKKLVLSIISLLMMFSVFCVDKDGVFGIYRVVLHEKAGTFSLSLVNPTREKFVPVLNPLDNSSGTILYLKSGSKIYPLSKSAGVAVEQEMTDTYAKITYTVKKVAKVVLNLSFCSSETGTFLETSDIAIVDIMIKNIGPKSRIFSLRGVFDTCLGENVAKHFSSKTLDSLNSEAIFNSMFADKWLKTSNGDDSIKFLLDGETITRPVNIVIANRDILVTDVWEPKIVPGRGFNSLYSLNNSAIGITWNSYKVSPDKLCGVRFYLSGASDGDESVDATAPFFTSGKAAKSAAFLSDSEKLVAEEVVQYVVLSNKDNEEDIDEKKTSKKQDEKIPEQKNEKKSEIVEETKNEKTAEVVVEEVTIPEIIITPEKLDEKYIQSLIAQIDEIEHNPELYDQSKVQYLNAELDAILEQLQK